tara:strand:- start:182 stop:577 length:396 start_codon:yes stop_codon:yes gene_type:complete
MKKLVILMATLSPFIASASEQHEFNIGDNWVLEARSNRLSSDSKVLYHIPSDAYHTYYARKFGDWDIFSMVNSRDVERLSKGDVIQIIESKYDSRIYKVKLLSSINKNKNFYVIAEDLKNYYKPIKEQINE